MAIVTSVMRSFRILISREWRKQLLQFRACGCSHHRQQHQFHSLLKITRGKPVTMASQPQMSWQKQLSTTAAFLQQFQNDKEFDVTKNPFFAKYSEKLRALAIENPEQYAAKLQELEDKLKEADAKRKQELTEPPKPKTGQTGSWPPKSLDEILKVDLVTEKSPEEIEEIWKQHHLKKDGVFSVIKGGEFDVMRTHGRQFPTFVYVLPRQDGFEFILSQFSEDNVYFTPLTMYQKMKETAQPCLTVAHFADFRDSKGIVLMAGKIDDRFLTQLEAVNLVKQMALFYGTESESRIHLVKGFNQSPGTFNHMDIIEEYKKIRQKVELFA